MDTYTYSIYIILIPRNSSQSLQTSRDRSYAVAAATVRIFMLTGNSRPNHVSSKILTTPKLPKHRNQVLQETLPPRKLNVNNVEAESDHPHFAKMSAPSLMKYIIKRPKLLKFLVPIADRYVNLAGYRKLGLM